MKKRIMAWLLILGVFVVATGCGNTSSNERIENAELEEDVKPDIRQSLEIEATTDSLQERSEDFQVAIFYYTYSDTYIGNVRSILDEKLDKAGISYRDHDSDNNQFTQMEQIKMALENGADVLIVNLVNASSTADSKEIIKIAQQAEVPVIFFNRGVAPEGEEGDVLGSYKCCAFIGTDAPQAGHMQGQMISEYLLANYDAVDLNQDGTIQYAMLKGQERNIEAAYRTQYSVEDVNAALQQAGKPQLEYFDENNELKYQVDKEGAWSAQAAREYMFQNLLEYNETKNNMIELIICNNDSMACGAIEALNQAGYNLGEEESVTIPIFGVDATEEAISLIERGRMTGTVKQDADGMAEAILKLTDNIKQGKELMEDTEKYDVSEQIPNKILIPYSLYTEK